MTSLKLRWDRIKDLHMINKDERGKIDCNFGRRPAPFMLFILLVMCSVEKNSPSRIGQRGF